MKQYQFNDLMEIIRELRSEHGCPWDREQTHESLKNCLLEECYETIDAINKKDRDNLREELGDVLLQVALHTAIAEEEKEFTIDEVTTEICEKMIRRHPHVFGDVVAEDSKEVLRNWEEIKVEEKKETRVSDGMLRVANALPSTIRAEKVQKKAAKVGFDFSGYIEALEKVHEELLELEEARSIGNLTHIEEEFGDVMFSIVNLSRFLGINAENSLTNATDKFINRFIGVERLAEGEGRHLKDLSIDELNALWGRIK